MPDKYSKFSDLEKSEKKGVDYGIDAVDRHSEAAIFAPHGGYIEPGTSQIATAIAGDSLSLYRFEGLKPGHLHGDLHITSHQFDEPTARQMAAKSDVVVAIHGRVDGKDPSTVWMGGLDGILRAEIERELSRAGFSATSEGHDLPARHPDNICNGGGSKAGVQLEIPRTLRDTLQKNPALLGAFSGAVRAAIYRVTSNKKDPPTSTSR